MDQVSLSIKGKIFRSNKDLLCENSDYFKGMFSGYYVENKLQVIKINILEPETMEIILKYMQIGSINLSDYSLTNVEDIALAASYLMMTELMIQINNYILELQISDSNWIQIMAIAEQCSFSTIGELAVSHGLLSFRNMDPHYIPSIQVLAWYLSHPYLDSESEIQIFRFGNKWLLHNKIGANALLIILGCLDIKRLSSLDINEIKEMGKYFKNSLAGKVVDCFQDLIVNKQNLTCQFLQDQKIVICKKFTKRVYSEVYKIVGNSTDRKLQYTSIIPIRWFSRHIKSEIYLYSFTKENKLKIWLDIADKNLWGWSVVSWRPNKIIIVCGEFGRGTGIFERDVRVYDTFRQKWTWHGVQLPRNRHAGCAVLGDMLFIVGGIGAFRVVLDTVIVYDLKQRSFSHIAKFPNAIQNIAICAFENNIYGAGHKNIYRYEVQGDGKDFWKTVISTDMRMSCMRSYKKYIYCIQTYFNYLYRFRPGIDEKLEIITTFLNPPSTICTMRDNLLAFTSSVTEVSSVEELSGDIQDEKPKVLHTAISLKVNEAAGSCEVVLEPPQTEWKMSPYVRTYLRFYN